MKRYPFAISQLFYRPMAITQARHAALCQILESRMLGDMPGMPQVEPDDDDKPTPDWQTNGRFAIIPVHGVITNHASDIPSSSCGCGMDTVSDMINVARADSEVETLIFDFRTPGGSVTGLPERARQIASIHDKKTIAFTDDECCSAGVWLATQCNYFYTTSSASVGSIGVWCAYLDISRKMENEGMNMQAISAGKYKLLGAYWKTLSDDERSMLQADVDKIYSQFSESVNLNREVDSKYMQGQVFDGAQAVEIGLCDGLVDSMDELIESEDGEE
jgi:protease IV